MPSDATTKSDYADKQDEIAAAQALLEPHVRTLESEQLRSCGKMYGNNPSNIEVADDPENWRYTWLRTFLAEVAQGVPQFIIEPRGLEWSPERAYVIEQAVNAQAHRERLDLTTHQTAIDYGFRSARGVCSLRRRKKRLEPAFDRLAFDELLTDPSMADRYKAAWWCHRVSRPIEMVIAEAKAQPDLGWDIDALNRIAVGLSRDPRSQRRMPAAVERHDLVYWVMWCPYEETGEPEKGYNGTVHYVLDPAIAQKTKSKGIHIRKAEPFFGPPEGPYAFAAGFKIGELHVELAPLVASASQGGFLNAIGNAIRDGAVAYKHVTVVQDDVTQATLTNSANGQILRVPRGPDIRTMVAGIETGGMQPQHGAAWQFFYEQFQRSLGTASRLGDIEASATATAIQNAQMGYATTMGLYVNSYHGFHRQIGSKWAYWYDLHPEVETRVGPLPPEIEEAFGERFVEIKGGSGSPEDHRGMALQVDPMSTRAKNEQTLQLDLAAAMQALQFVLSLGPNQLAVNGELIMRQTARARGAPWIEKLLDGNRARQVAAMMIGQQGEQPPPQPTGGSKVQLAFDPKAGASAPRRPVTTGSSTNNMGASKAMRSPKQPTPAGAA